MENEAIINSDHNVEKSVSLPNLFGIVSQIVLDDKSQNLIEQLAKCKKNIKPVSEEYCNDKENIRRRLSDSNRIISELLRDGLELVQDIQVANDKREVERRVKEAEIREELLETLHIETDEAVAKFETISEKWMELKKVKDPMGINDELQVQKECIQTLMKQKDNIIDECRKELKAADDRYTRDLLKQTTYIHSLVERVDNQIETMNRAFKDQLNLLENTIDEERSILRQATTKKWDDMYTRRAVIERLKMKQENERLEFYEDAIGRIEQEHIEMTRATRIRLEQDNQALEIELQNAKTKTTLNSEKLDYNFQVLKKREDENLLVRNAQKRRLTKLNETVFVLRRKIKDAQMSCLIETEKITSDIMKLRSTISQMDLKYQSVWQMNKNECVDILKSVFEIDKILTEQHLGRKWTFPTVSKDYTKKQTQLGAVDKDNNTCTTSKSVLNERDQFLDILHGFMEQAGFLVDKTVVKLMDTYAREDQSLVCLDNIFNALGISNWDDVKILREKFSCIENTRFDSNSVSTIKSDETNSDMIDRKFKVETDYKFIDQDVNSKLDASENLRSLKQFSEQLMAVDTILGSSEQNISSRKMSIKDVKEYWEVFRSVFSSDKVKIWTLMENNLTYYLQVLKDRKALDEECDFLRKQNLELQYLLQKMSVSKE
ncbi:dynein regulatory complex protein 1 homolog isoform X2 [Malaya genurostris]|uniref:dynein regulatory complex protein 1 homolog isoform X2 n=1 Tax=Malaya genurostris TaxID=325434 RepID=UPI0026F3A9D7|nr:dynein regulatory complex protein 1 homolog isoform X2 [Malaya genurostris]